MVITEQYNLSNPTHHNHNHTIEGEELDVHGEVLGNLYSHSGCVPCSATSEPTDDGHNVNLYCINGGEVTGYAGNCTCTSCDEGFGGTNCEVPSPCQATPESADEGSDGNFYCINEGTVGGVTGSCTCLECASWFEGPHCEIRVTLNTCDPGWGGPDCTTQLCPQGKYKEDAETFTCTNCPNGKYRSVEGGLSEEDCSSCGPFTTSSNDKTHCLSEGGYYIIEDKDGFKTLPVPEGVEEIPGTTLTSFELLPGYWRTSNSSSQVETCLSEKHCQGGSNTSQYCAVGHEGPLCAVCQGGFSSVGAAGSLSCNKCEGSTTITLAIGLTVFILFLLLVVWALLKKKTSTERSNSVVSSGITKFNAQLTRATNKFERFEPVIKICFAYFQVVGNLSFLFSLKFPPFFTNVTGFLSGLFSLDLISVMPVGCIFESTHYTILLSYTILPLFISCILISWYLWLSEKEDEGSINLRNKVFEVVLALTFLILPSVSIKIFSTFACQEFDDGNSFLKVDYNLDCNSARHTAFEVYAWIMILVYPVGIPLGYFIMLFRVRKLLKAGQVEKENEEGRRRGLLEEALAKRKENEEKNPTLRALSFLYDSYEPKYWWFEIFETLRKLSLTGLMVFLAPGTAGQVVISLIMSIIAFFVYSRTDPFVDSYNNYLSLVANAQLVATLVGALAIKVNMDDANLREESSFDVFMTSVQFVPAVLLGIVTLLMARRAKSTSLQSIVPEATE
jgi:hypothetical protein